METSRSILVTQPALRVKYSYDCSSFGGPGNFIADFQTANENSLKSDSQSIASAVSPGGAATVTIYPRNAGQRIPPGRQQPMRLVDHGQHVRNMR
jgi:hypothetical protein